ncbi:MAG: tetratricopeptide repeat protein [Bacteroidetes bacterium]|nr:tetratricopeptide repeat protein [Bacteroidota bacterium]
MKLISFFNFLILVIPLGLKAQVMPVWMDNGRQDIIEFNREVEAYLSSKEPGCITYTENPVNIESKYFHEVDEWLKPVFFKSGPKLISLKPAGKKGQNHALGDSLYHVRKYQQAREAYLTSIKSNPDNWFSYLYLGDTFFIFDQLDTTRYWFEASVRKNPRSWKAWKYLGDLYFESGDSVAAIDAAVRSILLNPYGFESWGLLGIIGKRYGFSIWNPADSTPVVFDSLSRCLVVQRKFEKSKDYRAMTNFILMKQDSLQENKIWEEGYSIFASTWEKERPDSLADLYKREPFREYLVTLQKTGNLKLHVSWTHLLSRYPEAGMVLPDEDFDTMVDFVKSHFLLYDSEE